MLRRLKSHLDTTMDKFLSAETKDENSKPSKFEYSRPEFLHLNDEKLKVSQDFANRPIVTPSDQLPFNAGYAEYEIIIFFTTFVWKTVFQIVTLMKVYTYNKYVEIF